MNIINIWALSNSLITYSKGLIYGPIHPKSPFWKSYQDIVVLKNEKIEKTISRSYLPFLRLTPMPWKGLLICLTFISIFYKDHAWKKSLSPFQGEHKHKIELNFYFILLLLNPKPLERGFWFVLSSNLYFTKVMLEKKKFKSFSRGT